MKLLTIKNITKGFSLIEVVVALFILSVSVMAIYTLIISTASSSYNLEQRYLAKEVADNMIFMDEGRIVEKAKTNDFFENPKSDRTKLFLSQIL